MAIVKRIIPIDAVFSCVFKEQLEIRNNCGFDHLIENCVYIPKGGF